MKSTLYLIAVLVIFSGMPRLSAQTLPPLPDLVLDTGLHPDVPYGFSVKISGTAGEWAHVMIRCYSTDAEAVATYPWLAVVDSEIPVYSTYHIPNQAGLNDEFIRTRQLVKRIGADATEIDYVRFAFQNLPSPDGGPSTSSIEWVARPDAWIGAGNPEADIRKSWVKRLSSRQPDDAEDSRDFFDLEKCARFAMRQQAPTPAIADQAWEQNARHWLPEGTLQLSVQAIALVNSDVVANPGTEGDPTGLADLPDPPRIQVGSPKVISIVVRAPAFTSNSGDIGESTFPSEAIEGSQLTLALDGIIPPMALTVEVDGISLVLTGGLSPLFGHASFPLPPQISAGSVIELISLENAVTPDIVAFPSWVPTVPVVGPAGPPIPR